MSFVFSVSIKDQVVMPARTIQLIPIELVILPTGSTKDRPSFGLILATADLTPVVVTQLSFQMLFNNMDQEMVDLLEAEWRRMKHE